MTENDRLLIHSLVFWDSLAIYRVLTCAYIYIYIYIYIFMSSCVGGSKAPPGTISVIYTGENSK